MSFRNFTTSVSHGWTGQYLELVPGERLDERARPVLDYLHVELPHQPFHHPHPVVAADDLRAGARMFAAQTAAPLVRRVFEGLDAREDHLDDGSAGRRRQRRCHQTHSSGWRRTCASITAV